MTTSTTKKPRLPQRRTRATIGVLARRSIRRTRLQPSARSRLTRSEQARRRRQQAMRLNISIRYQGRLKILIDIGPVWIGVIITMLATSVWPQLHPLLQFLPSLTGVSLPILDVLRRG